MPERPVVLFVCIQNAGRSQMAEEIFNDHAERHARARSAGSAPADEVHAVVVGALAEIGIDVSGKRPKALTHDLTDGVNVVVTMGCGDACTVIPGARVVDWDLDDPAGRDIDEVRRIRDEISRRVDALLAEIGAA